MPKDAIDYSNTIIYKIFCNDPNVKDIYIGHTTNFVKRKYQHKTLSISSEKLNIYDSIRNNGGWTNWSMIEIAKYNCQDATEARNREQHHYDLIKCSSNKNNRPYNYVCQHCQKGYAARNSLWYHQKKCSSKESGNERKIGNTDKDLIMLLIKENSELKSLMGEVIKNGININTNQSNNHNSFNTSFNLQFFLNETCKNAMNITDFADSIQLQLSDLEDVGEVGYVQGISNIIVKNLQSLDVTERPVHCADKKREILYIKDGDKWEKEDDDKKRIKKVIKKVEFKNQRLLSKYKEIHPGCNMSESEYADQYSKIVIEAMGGVGNNDNEKHDKIISNISKEVVIDKASVK